MRTVNPLVEAAISAVSPRNLYGEPVFRCMWSADVLHWCAGWWNDYDKESGVFIRKVWEVRKVPKYQMAARWIIERWMPPEFYGIRETWEEATRIVSEDNHLDFALELGPYPSRGDYIHLWTCDGPNGEYIDITPILAEYAVQLALLPVPSVAAMESLAKDRIAAEDERKLKAVDDMVGDCFPFLGRTSNVSPTSLMKKIREQKKRGLSL